VTNYVHHNMLRAQVVTLAEAIPVSGSGFSLPLDLHLIAARCRNSYYAPKKFSAVQLAYNEPRCRVLVFRAPLTTHSQIP
jgi:TATA-box binding protein (TBP) (component of TFIID and TFIIIB)